MVAIKLEHHSIAPSLLRQEMDIYEELIGQPGIPRVFWHGYHCDFEALVFELLGPNLEDLLRYCDNKFTLKTTLMLMDQILHRIVSLHKVGYLHRDIKPENFPLSTGKQGNIVYMTDLDSPPTGGPLTTESSATSRQLVPGFRWSAPAVTPASMATWTSVSAVNVIPSLIPQLIGGPRSSTMA